MDDKDIMMDIETLQVMGLMLMPLCVMGAFFVKKVIDTDKCLQKIKTFLKMKYTDDSQISALF